MTRKEFRMIKREARAKYYQKVALMGGGTREVARRKRQLEKKNGIRA